jgi:DNA polymerase-1
VREDEQEQMESLVRREMEHAADLRVPLVVDMGSGCNWLVTKSD